jgi:glucose-6-phosphate 1-dehydrogenase
VVDRILHHEGAVNFYEPGSWGPAEAAHVVSGNEGWHDPQAEESTPC